MLDFFKKIRLIACEPSSFQALIKKIEEAFLEFPYQRFIHRIHIELTM
jgi:hypothetical protein